MGTRKLANSPGQRNSYGYMGGSRTTHRPTRQYQMLWRTPFGTPARKKHGLHGRTVYNAGCGRPPPRKRAKPAGLAGGMGSSGM